jgi:hypothetical protein
VRAVPIGAVADGPDRPHMRAERPHHITKRRVPDAHLAPTDAPAPTLHASQLSTAAQPKDPLTARPGVNCCSRA